MEEWRGGYTDLHSHLVPGVDDGSRSLEDSRDALGRFQEVGVTCIVTTPHLDGSLTRNKESVGAWLSEMDEAWKTLLSMAESEFPDLELQRGHEVMLDIPDPELSDPRIHLGDTRYVLVEWPGLQVPPFTGPVLERIVGAGLKPIIAHPERYRGLDREVLLPGGWKNDGALLQVNYGSLVGRYGDLPRKRALTLLERGWVDLLASDFHGRPHLSPSLAEAREALVPAGGSAQFELLAGVNPTRILRDADPLPVPPLRRQPGIWQKLTEIFGRDESSGSRGRQ
jgi:protein-tyrosine phosphatase